MSAIASLRFCSGLRGHFCFMLLAEAVQVDENGFRTIDDIQSRLHISQAEREEFRVYRGCY